MVGTVKYEARIKELVENLPDVAVLVEPLLVVRRVLREQVGILHRRLLAIVRDDDVCRRLMTVPGVGPVVALTYRATVDVPACFRNSKAVGAVFGLTPSKYQSGESDRTGAISRCGDEMMRAMLYEAAQSMLVRSAKWSWLKAWAMKIARHRGMKKAIVALARRLAVIMHRIWVDGTEFRWTREVAAARRPTRTHIRSAAARSLVDCRRWLLIWSIQVTVIVAAGVPPTRAAKAATTSIVVSSLHGMNDPQPEGHMVIATMVEAIIRRWCCHVGRNSFISRWQIVISIRQRLDRRKWGLSTYQETRLSRPSLVRRISSMRAASRPTD